MGYNPFSLENKTIFVTGASSGIGKATAIECSKMGAKLVITARNDQRLKDTLSQLEGSGHHMFVCDLNKTDEIDSMIKQLPKLNGFVNNAGIMITMPTNFVTEEKLKSIININMNAPILLFSKLLNNKKIEKNSSIVFTSSIGGTMIANIGNGLYGATKGGVTAFAKVAALEYASKGIRINCVCPGMIDTNIMKGGTISEEQLQKDMLNYPLRRYGKPEEVAYAIIYLLSDASSFVTGSNLVIDGGYTIR